MNKSAALIAVVAALYLFSSIDYAIKGKAPQALMCFSYVLGNIGLIWLDYYGK